MQDHIPRDKKLTCVFSQLQVPSLIHGIRNVGLLVGIHKVTSTSSKLTKISDFDGTPIDAYGNEGVITFIDHSMGDI
jgi:CDK inhibitor PHO81